MHVWINACRLVWWDGQDPTSSPRGLAWGNIFWNPLSACRCLYIPWRNRRLRMTSMAFSLTILLFSLTLSIFFCHSVPPRRVLSVFSWSSLFVIFLSNPALFRVPVDEYACKTVHCSVFYCIAKALIYIAGNMMHMRNTFGKNNNNILFDPGAVYFSLVLSLAGKFAYWCHFAPDNRFRQQELAL